MGLDRTIRFPQAHTPDWPVIAAQLHRVEETATLVMIDGMPAFPDETPDATWKELRIKTTGGMVTLRRGGELLSCVIWGNADADLQQSWSKVIWACAAAGEGMVELPGCPLTSMEFAQAAGLLPS